MPLNERDSRPQNQTAFRWILILLVMGVLTVSILAFSSPVSQGRQAATLSPTEAEGLEINEPTQAFDLTQTADADAMPPTPEEIGYTDGIIFMSTVLILILLVATLRETIRRKGR